LIIAFLIVIVAALGTVLLVSDLSTNTQVRGYLRWSMNANTMTFAEELNRYYHEHGSWAGVDTMFMESGMENNWMGDSSNQMDGQHQGQGKGQPQGPGAAGGITNVQKKRDSRGPERASTLRGG
jgi:hypothetical protein